MARYRKNGIPGEVKTLSRIAKIMVVDDDQVARLLLVKVLDLGGYETIAVDSGAKALEEFTKCPYDLLILDLEMPGMKGMELLEKLLAVYPDLRVIILTAYGTMDSAIQALRYKVNDYLLNRHPLATFLKVFSGYCHRNLKQRLLQYKSRRLMYPS